MCPVVREIAETQTSSAGRAIAGIGRKSALLASVKIVLLTPIHKARVAIPPKANIGLRESDRTAYLQSCVIDTGSFSAK